MPPSFSLPAAVNHLLTRIKICGITRPQDAVCAARLGVDAIGLVFHGPSKRAVTVAQATEVVAALPAFVTSVGLFVNEDAEVVREVLRQVPLDLLQFHGDESRDYCESFARPYIKALRMKPDLDLATAVSEHPHARGILLDAWHRDQPGGTGSQFDWRLARAMPAAVPMILAGGLDQDNVAEAIASLRPYAVDVSSGVEQGAGIKPPALLQAFVAAVRAADAQVARQTTAFQSSQVNESSGR